MEVAVMYSGGKDSTYAIAHCMEKKYKIKYLLSIKPTRTDCFLFHYATVEHTKELANIFGIKHIYETCDVADPQKEAQIVRNIVAKNPVEALVLGGTGLQKTQIKAIRDALFDLGVEVFATHSGEDHGNLLYEMIDNGYEIIITQIATEGLGKDWLGRKLTRENYLELKKLSEKYGFHIGFEGGYADTLVVDGPIFTKKLEIVDAEKIMQSKYEGYLKINKLRIIDKLPKIYTSY